MLLLSAAAGLIGTWIVLRGLAFYAHAIGTAAFPGLVLADGLWLLAAARSIRRRSVSSRWPLRALGRRRRDEYGSFTALVLVGALALGVILASDVFDSGSNVETLLFGSLLLSATASSSSPARGASSPRRRDVRSAGAGSRRIRPGGRACARRALGAGGRGAAARSSRSPSSPRSPRSARCSRRRCSSCPRRRRGLDADAPLLAARVDRARRGGGRRRAVALGRGERPARARRSRCWPAASFALAALAALPRGAAAGRGRGAALARSRPGAAPAAGESAAVVATTTQIGDWARAVGGDAVSVHQILQPNTDPHEYEPRPGRAGDARREGRPRERRRARRLDGQGRRCRRATPSVVDLGAVARLPVGGGDGRSALVARPAQRRGRGRARSATRSRVPTRRTAATFRRNAARLPGELRELDRSIAACFARSARPSASSSPTTTRSATSRAATGSRSSARSSVADDPVAALGGRDARTDRARPARARSRDLSRELAQPAARRAVARATARPRTTRCTATRSGRRARAARRTSRWSARTPTRWCAASPAGGAAARSSDAAPCRAGLAAGYGGPPVIDEVTFERAARASGSASSARTAAASRRSSASSSASSTPSRGDGPGTRALRLRAADRALAARLSRSARSTSR